MLEINKVYQMDVLEFLKQKAKITLKIVDTDTYPNEDPTKPKFRRFI